MSRIQARQVDLRYRLTDAPTQPLELLAPFRPRRNHRGKGEPRALADPVIEGGVTCR